MSNEVMCLLNYMLPLHPQTDDHIFMKFIGWPERGGRVADQENKNGIEQYSLSQDYAKDMKNFMV